MLMIKIQMARRKLTLFVSFRRASTTMGTGAPKAHSNSVYYCYGCLPEPPVTITILAIILLAIYVAAGSI
jgi:hypothetical protein